VIMRVVDCGHVSMIFFAYEEVFGGVCCVYFRGVFFSSSQM